MIESVEALEAASVLCDHCDAIEASEVVDGVNLCRRCVQRRVAGLPPKLEVEAADSRALRDRLVWYVGAYNRELS